MVVASKQAWESNLAAAVGDDYVLVGSSTLGAIHLALFAWKPVVPRITAIFTGEVATGVANVVKNKGATAISVQLQSTSILFLNCHLAPDQDQVDRRNADWHRIDSELSGAFSQFRPKSSSLLAQFDVVFWFGDLNYRVMGNRAAIDGALASNLTEVLVANDQLGIERRKGKVLTGYSEGSLTFAPTYKFDSDSDKYDTSKSKRVPSWTDRVFQSISPSVELLEYRSRPEIWFSDHRPVEATFLVRINHEQPLAPGPGAGGAVSSKVCVVL